MRFRVLLLSALLPLLASGCLGGDGGDESNLNDTNDGGGVPGGGTGGNATNYTELTNVTLTLGAQSSNVLPGSNASVSTPVNVTAGYSSLVVNTTIVEGTAVGLRFSGLGDCSDDVGAPAQPGRTYSTDCGAVDAGSYNLTYSHTSGSVTFRVVVLGAR